MPKKDGRQRPVINLKALNEFVQPRHFKMEGFHTLRKVLKPGDWFAKVDLKIAYFAIPIAEDQRKFLRFTVDGQPLQFNCLPFGQSCALWIFTETLKPVAALLRELAVQMVVYIDDILLLAESREEMTSHILGLVFLY